MLKPGECSNLADEADLAGFGRGIRIENLERDLPLVFQVSREKHGGVRTLSDLPLYLVAAAQGLAQRLYRVGRRTIR